LRAFDAPGSERFGRVSRDKRVKARKVVFHCADGFGQLLERRGAGLRQCGAYKAALRRLAQVLGFFAGKRFECVVVKRKDAFGGGRGGDQGAFMPFTEFERAQFGETNRERHAETFFEVGEVFTHALPGALEAAQGEEGVVAPVEEAFEVAVLAQECLRQAGGVERVGFAIAYGVAGGGGAFGHKGVEHVDARAQDVEFVAPGQVPGAGRFDGHEQLVPAQFVRVQCRGEFCDAFGAGRQAGVRQVVVVGVDEVEGNAGLRGVGSEYCFEAFHMRAGWVDGFFVGWSARGLGLWPSEGGYPFRR
jgi:hypothetical protein